MKQPEIMLTAFAEKQAKDCSIGWVDEDLTFECMPFLLARIELLLTLLGTLNRGLGDINDNDCGTTKPLH